MRILILILAILPCLPLPDHGAAGAADPWLEMEKGLQLCSVEINSYRSCRFIDRDERKQVLSAGAGPLKIDLQAVPDCSCSVQDGCGDDEVLFEIYGADREACRLLSERFAAAAGWRGDGAGQVWSVEGSHELTGDLTALGKELVQALGGRLRQINTSPRTVQLLAELPWAGAGIMLDEGHVNLTVELYEDTYLEKVRIRLGIPLLF